MARRLLVIGGIALGGWLLGSADQVHAETEPAPVAGLTRAVASAVPELPRPDGIRPDGTVTDRPAERATRAVKAHHGEFGDFVHDVAAPVRSPGFGGLPGTVERVVTGPIPVLGGGAGPDAHSSSQYPDGAVVGDSGRAAPPPGGIPLKTAEVRDGSAHFRAGSADPASQPGYPRGAACHPVAPQSAGSVLNGGTAGHPARLGAVARPSTVLASVLGAIPPAVHTATDEPALSPD
jgi:hypothetical protein